MHRFEQTKLRWVKFFREKTKKWGKAREKRKKIRKRAKKERKSAKKNAKKNIMNHKANLINICSPCHDLVHSDNLVLKIYKTTNGYEIM